MDDSCWKYAGDIYTFEKMNNPEDYLHLLGTMPDRQLALQVGVSREYIRQLRAKHNIAKFKKEPDEWSQDDLDLLGKMTDEEVAELIGKSVSAISNKRQKLRIPAFGITHWTPDVIALLGKRFDKQIAEQLGISDRTVWRKRKKLGIPAYRYGKNKA